jgi:hypothetical protein
VSGAASNFDPIRSIGLQQYDIHWDSTYPDPVTIFHGDGINPGIVFAHPGLDSAGLRAGITQALSRADTNSLQEAARYAAHLLINGVDLAHACAHNRDVDDAARSLGVTVALFNERISSLNRRGRNALRLAVAKDYCPRCRVRQGPLGLDL